MKGASSEAYGKMDTDEMLRIVKSKAVGALKVIIFQKIPTLTKNQTTYQGKPKISSLFWKKVLARNLSVH